MKKLIYIAATLIVSCAPVTPTFAEELCKVQVCNKLERFTFDIGSLIMDELGETCSEAIIEKHYAKEGKELSSESRWYQGSSINPTKRSVTRVNKVYSCFTVTKD